MQSTFYFVSERWKGPGRAGGGNPKRSWRSFDVVLSPVRFEADLAKVSPHSGSKTVPDRSVPGLRHFLAVLWSVPVPQDRQLNTRWTAYQV